MDKFVVEHIKLKYPAFWNKVLAEIFIGENENNHESNISDIIRLYDECAAVGKPDFLYLYHKHFYIKREYDRLSSINFSSYPHDSRLIGRLENIMSDWEYPAFKAIKKLAKDKLQIEDRYYFIDDFVATLYFYDCITNTSKEQKIKKVIKCFIKP